MASRLDLDAVQSAFLGTAGGFRVGVADALDVLLLRRLGKHPVGHFSHRRGRDDRQPVLLRPACAAAKVGNLVHDSRAVALYRFGQGLVVRNDSIGRGIDIAEGGG